MKKQYTFNEKLTYFKRRVQELEELAASGFNMNEPAGQDWNSKRLESQLQNARNKKLQEEVVALIAEVKSLRKAE